MNGIGRNNTSLLHKTGRLRAFEMTSLQLEEMVRTEQTRRSFQRAVGRTLRINKNKPSPAITSLEQLGLAPEICILLRAKGLSEVTLIAQIRKAGLL